ncbi:MAG: DUF131 domain-containing protein [Candidatus Korarchaeum sp.]
MYELVVLMLVLAFLMIALGFLLLLSSAPREGVRGGGVIVIGPIPIVLGTDQQVAKGLMILAILLVLVTTLMFLMLLRAAG